MSKPNGDQPWLVLADDHAGIHAGPVEAAHDPRMLDLDAAIHHDVESGRARDPRGLLAPDAELHPQHLGALGDGRAREVRHLLGLAEAIDDVDVAGRNRGHGGIRALAQDLGRIRIDRDDAVAMLLHVLRREEARAIPVRRQADHGDDARARQDPREPRDVVDDGHRRDRYRGCQFGLWVYGYWSRIRRPDEILFFEARGNVP